MPEALTPQAPKRVNVISPYGEIGTIDQGELQAALQSGYKVQSDEAALAYDAEKAKSLEYGDRGVEAGLAGLARGATFGLSDVALTQTGLVKPETLAGLKEYNPGASTVGDIAGVVGTSLAGPGAALVKGAAKIGESVAGKFIAGEAAKKIAAATIGSAIEGTAFATSQPISEAALGDPTLTAQRAFAEIGIGTLLGAGIGGVISALGAGAKKILPQIKTAVKEADDVAAAASVPREVIEGADDVAASQGSQPFKAEGKIVFDMPDEKILKQAEAINPKNPLKQNDLDFIKEFGAPDATGKPTIFAKIGTDEVPTLNLASKTEVTLADKLEESMHKLTSMTDEMEAKASEILDNTPIYMGRNTYKKMFKDVQKSIEKSPDFGTPIGKKAYNRLQEFVDAADDMPAQISAPDVRRNLQMLRKETKIYSIREGLKDDFISSTLNDAQRNIDEFLKTKVPGYRDVMKEYAPLVKLSTDLENHFKMDLRDIKSDLISNWTENRVVKPFQNQLYGSMKPTMQADADILTKLGDLIGLDIGKTVKANLVFGKINPELAQGLQKGTWGANVAQNLDILARPTEIPGKVLSGTAKMVLTGEMPDFVKQIQAKGIQDILLGRMESSASSKNIIQKITQGIGEGTSKLFDASSGYGQLMTPVGVKAFLDMHNNVEEADQKLGTLVALEKANQRYEANINATVKSMFTTEPHVAEESKGLTKFLTNKTSQDHAKELEKLRDDVNLVTNDANVLIDRLTQSMKGVTENAPNIATAINMTAVRAINLLSSKISTIYPQEPNLLLDPKYAPSRDQIASLAKTIKFINKPQDVLKDVKNKIVSKEALEVMTQVYPELYADMKSQVIMAITKQHAAGKMMPIANRNPTAMFLGQPLEKTQSPDFIRSSQALLQGMTKQQQQKDAAFQGSSKATPARADKLNLSSRTGTALQKVVNR